MQRAQSAILSPPPPAGRFVTLGLATDASARAALDRVAALRIGDSAGDGASGPSLVVGIGDPLLRAAGAQLDGLRPFPALSGPGGAFPSTQGALWLFLGGRDPGEVLHATRRVLSDLGEPFRVDEEVGTFVFGSGRDLSGYEDGTENPQGPRIAEVALVAGDRPALAGSSFVAGQRWVHDLTRLEGMAQRERDFIVGRDRVSNEELADAPPTAHVKRAAQESFEPAAFMVRRSMPWGDVQAHGLYFVAYAASLDPYERVLRRMAGLEDGVPDALLRFTRPVTGGYYWCPPVSGDRLDLRAL
jgi:putative iron-dependent peroxidase